MERAINDDVLSSNQINEMEERRIERMNNDGIDEGAVLERANKNRNSWISGFQENITRGKDDVNFLFRDQWSAVERSEFTRLFKPAMTFNELYPPVKKIIGEQRKNKPDLIVRSLTGKATQQEIDLRADLVRTISYQSQNDLIYQTAFKSALTLGFGAFQVCVGYRDHRSFQQIIYYDLINDPTLCAWDMSATKPHKGDGNHCSRIYILSRDEFFATYPYITNPVSFAQANLTLDSQFQTNDNIMICEEFVKEWYPLIIYKLSNGDVVTSDEWKERQKKFEGNKEIVQGSVVGEIVLREMPKIVAERQTQDYKTMQYRMIRDQIVDYSQWPSKYLPIIFADGESEYIEGRQYTKSFIRDARDAQKLLNYSRSELTAELKNRRREQWLGTPDNIVGNEQQWRNPELQQGILLATPDPKTGQMPIKMPAWEVSQGLFVTAQSAKQDIQEILGFSESQELQGRDISGKARRERKIEGAMAAYSNFDNLNQAIEQGGRVTLDLLPYIIGDEERPMKVTKKDGKTVDVILNQKVSDDKILNKITTGDFDIEIDTGASFAVQKEIALEFLADTMKVAPQAFNLIADLWAKNLDVQFSAQISDRFQTLVPPEILAKEKGEPPPPSKPNPEQMMMQQQMMAQQQQMKMNEQKMQIEEQQILERAEELKLRKEKHLLEQAEMILKAKEMQSQIGVNEQKNKIELAKLDNDFSAKMAALMTEIHQGQQQRHHERQMNLSNSNSSE